MSSHLDIKAIMEISDAQVIPVKVEDKSDILSAFADAFAEIEKHTVRVADVILNRLINRASEMSR